MNNCKKYQTSRKWFSDGQLANEFNYLNDKLHGIQRVWYKNGQLKCETICVNGETRNDLKDNKLAQVVIFGKVLI